MYVFFYQHKYVDFLGSGAKIVGYEKSKRFLTEWNIRLLNQKVY